MWPMLVAMHSLGSWLSVIMIIKGETWCHICCKGRRDPGLQWQSPTGIGMIVKVVGRWQLQLDVILFFSNSSRSTRSWMNVSHISVSPWQALASLTSRSCGLHLGGCHLPLLLGHKHRCALLAMTLLAGTRVWGRRQYPKARPCLWQEMIARNGARQMLKSLCLPRIVLRGAHILWK